MRTPLRLMLLCFCYLLPSGYLQAMSSNSYLPQLPQGSRSSVYIYELNKRKALSIKNDQVFPPASTLKVLTALAAKLELGDDFRFNTQIERLGHDLIIRFSGDPTLKSEDISALLQQIKAQGINTIQGDIWLDNRLFTGYEKAVGWPWDILGVCYSAPASSINIDGNCIQSSIYTEKNGQTRVFLPEHYPVEVVTNALSVTEEQQKSSYCDLELQTTPDNHYRLSGCLIERSRPLPLKFAVQNTELYAQQTISNLLAKLEIKLNGAIKIVTVSKSGEVLATHQSQPLTELLDTMLKDSNNLIADTLTKTLGQHVYQQPGSFSNGTAAIKQVIKDHTGISLEQDQFADGSGLSRNNRIRVSSMMNVLYYIWQHDQELELIQLLPSSGESGTLQYRASMREEMIRGKIKAKSGSLYGTYNMVGFGLDKQGKPNSIFIQYITDYFPPKIETEVPIEQPLVTFEKAFYKQVIESSN